MKKLKWIILFVGIIMIACGICLIFIQDKSKKLLKGEPVNDYIFSDTLVDYTVDTLPKEYENYDFDGDGIKNNKEIELGTNMYKVDTDGDGISDFDEVNKTKTEPLKWSSRDDDISDLEFSIINNDSFEEGYSNLHNSGYRVYLKEPSDRLFVISKVKSNAFNNLETISETYQIKYFSGKLALDCSKYIDEVVNSISIYKLVDGKAQLVESLVEENKMLSFEIFDGDIFCAVYSK